MKLRARITTMTGTAGSRSQGEMARAWMFWACWSSTPHEMAGGGSPRPREDNDVSLMIMSGVARGVGARVWVRNEGTRWVWMIRSWPRRARAGADKKEA